MPDPVSVWQFKIRNLGRKVRGWSRNRDSKIRKNRHELIKELDELDLLAEHQNLSEEEQEMRKELSLKLDKSWRIEETKAWQRARDRDIKGDRNTSYFFAKANQKKRKKTIARLEEDDKVFSNNESMFKHAVLFYKNLFCKEKKENIALDEDFWGEEDKILPEENELLEAELTKKEIKKAIDESYAVGAPGPDGFSFLFYQRFWPLIKKDFMAMVKGFEKGEVNVARLNYATIILIPKEEEGRTLKIFRPISLINCSFKIFAKVLNNRLETICDRLLAPNQSAFVKDRYILERVVSTHEIIHEAVKRG
jgi:hypothetical protein